MAIHRVNTLPGARPLVNGDEYIVKNTDGTASSYKVGKDGEPVFLRGISDDDSEKIKNSYSKNQVDEKVDLAVAQSQGVPIPITGTVLPQGTDIPSVITIQGSADLYGGSTGATYTQNGGSPIVVSANKFKKAFYSRGTNLWTDNTVEYDLPLPQGTDVLNPSGLNIPKELAVANYVDLKVTLVDIERNTTESKQSGVKSRYFYGGIVGSINTWVSIATGKHMVIKVSPMDKIVTGTSIPLSFVKSYKYPVNNANLDYSAATGFTTRIATAGTYIVPSDVNYIVINATDATGVTQTLLNGKMSVNGIDIINGATNSVTGDDSVFTSTNSYGVAPKYLSMEYLRSMANFGYIHHDSFCRPGNATVIGKNSMDASVFPSYPTNAFAYTTLSNAGAAIDIGVLAELKPVEERVNEDVNDQRNYYHFAYNSFTGSEGTITFKYVDAGRKNYKVLAKRRSISATSDAKVAFRIQDINNYYYIQATASAVNLYSVVNGVQVKLNELTRYDNTIVTAFDFGCQELSFEIYGDFIYIFADGVYIFKAFLKYFSNATLCGLMFSSARLSEVSDFNITARRLFNDRGIDNVIEKNVLTLGVAFEAVDTHDFPSDGRITTNKTITNNSKYSLREWLKWYPASENAQHSPLERTEMLIQRTDRLLMPTYIISFDFFLPTHGDEYWGKDSKHDYITQVHAPMSDSPSICFGTENDVLFLTVRGREPLTDVSNQYRSDAIFNIGNLENATITGLPLVEKGKWHNVCIFVKEGYTAAQQPRTIVYLDEEKVVDTDAINVYNAPVRSYFKLGIYKSVWGVGVAGRDVHDVDQRVVYYDNIMYL